MESVLFLHKISVVEFLQNQPLRVFFSSYEIQKVTQIANEMGVLYGIPEVRCNFSYFFAHHKYAVKWEL